jgi:hypothetical protein
MSVIGTLAGTLGGIVTKGPVGGLISGAAGTASNLVLQGISSWVLNGTKGALEQVAAAIGATTAPNLNSTWFSSTYWRVAALAAMLTIPFLCAAAVQAMARGDLGLLARAAFGYLPLSVLGVSLAAPMTMLLLAATDQMSAVVSASAATGGARFLDHAAQIAGALSVAANGAPFFAVVVGLFAVMSALALAVELLIRAAAVYVVVLMLPLAFAALVWPARRVWAARMVELLVSLVLSKFVIVAVLTLAASAFTVGTPGIGELLVAMSLILLSTFAPWALMRVLPFTELAAGAAGIIGGELSHAKAHAATAAGMSAGPSELAMQLPARLRDHARQMYGGTGDRNDGTYAATGADTGVSPRAATGADTGVSPRAAAGAPTRDHDLSPIDNVPLGPDTVTPAADAMTPAADAMTPAAGTTAPAPGAAPAQDERPPFVLPDAWQRSGTVRLDGQLLRPPSDDDGREEQR